MIEGEDTSVEAEDGAVRVQDRESRELQSEEVAQTEPAAVQSGFLDGCAEETDNSVLDLNNSVIDSSGVEFDNSGTDNSSVEFDSSGIENSDGDQTIVDESSIGDDAVGEQDSILTVPYGDENALFDIEDESEVTSRRSQRQVTAPLELTYNDLGDPVWERRTLHR